MRNIQDADLTKSIAVASAAASSETASFDLGQAGDAIIEVIELRVDVPVLPALVDTKTIIFTIQDSADNSSFAAVPNLGTYTVTGTETPGTAVAFSNSWKLTGTTRRYVRISGAVLAGAGDNTAVSFTASIRT
jgi:hypothetical protein